MSFDGSILRVGEILSSKQGGTSRVSVKIDGDPIWFESDDVDLAANTEAYASALLIPAIATGRTLSFEQPISSTWLSNCRQLLRVLNEWWQYPELVPQAPTSKTERDQSSLKTALCFSGGVDSFYSLLQTGAQIDYLVSAHGFDTPLSDSVRIASIESSIRKVANATATAPVFIRTNLREHPLVARTDWERAHGGALAALGHLLNPIAGRLLISSSHPIGSGKPWGTHWRIDAFWSSAWVQVIQAGADKLRREKVRALANELLVQEHLRVCWENRAPTGNCSICEKCLRTRIALTDHGVLDKFSGFRGPETLAEDLDSLPFTLSTMRPHRDALERGRLDPRTLRAIEGLIARSTHPTNESAKPLPSQVGKLWSLIKRLAR